MSNENRKAPARLSVHEQAVALCDHLEAEYPTYSNCMGDARIMHMNAPSDEVRQCAEKIMAGERDWRVEFYPFQKDTHREFGVIGGEFHMSPIGRRRKQMGLGR